MDTSRPALADQPLLCGGRSCAEEARHPLSLLSGRWVFPILEGLHLEGGACRFRPLQRRVGAVSQKELTRHLHAMMKSGVVRRCESGPRDVVYELTPRGLSLLQGAQGLIEWGREGKKPQAAASWLAPIVRSA